MVRQLCIIGFGVSGMSCLSWAKKLNIDAIVFESNSTFGGCWHSASYDSAKLQTPKESYSFSDFKMPETYSKYPNRDEVLEYFKNYIEFHNLNKWVYYNHKIIKAFFNKTIELWEIEVQNTKTLKNISIKSKYLAICSGFYNKPNIINLPNSDNFNGTIIHSKEFSKTGKYDYSLFKNKKVVLVGNGPSGCDLSCDAVENQAQQVTLLYKSNRWILVRKKGIFKFRILLNRFFLKLGINIPKSLYLVFFFIVCYIPLRYYYKIPISLPNKKLNRKNTALNINFLRLVSKQKITYKKALIKHLNNTSITLQDDSIIDADVIVLCTGYKQSTCFIDNCDLNLLYKRILPLNTPNCGFIGFSPSFNWVQISEQQSRWYLNWILNKIKVPRKLMIRDILKTHKKQQQHELEYFDLSYEPFSYLDDLYKDIKKTKINNFNLKNWFTTLESDHWN